MQYAEKVEFMDRPAIALGNVVSGRVVDRIEIHYEVFQDHSEMIVQVYAGKERVQTCWDMPCCVTYKLPPVEATL